MKWVNIGLVTAAGFVIIASCIDRRRGAAIIGGGTLAAGLMYLFYVHARNAGLRSGEPETESWT
jgi:hypothetical protein